jgi:hypothetical protein
MALYPWQTTLAERQAPLLCLDYLHFARRVYGQDDARWFESGNLLSTCRQAQQGLKPDVMVFPLYDWVAAWWQANGGAKPQASRPTKALKLALENTALVAALCEVLHALGTLNRSDAALALSLGKVEDWLRWVNPAEASDKAVDEGDAEDVCVYLAALAHKLPATAFGSLFVSRSLPIDGDASVAFDPLVNTARHFGWALVLCAQDGQGLPDGFDLVAGQQPQGEQGLWAQANWWRAMPMANAARFVVCAIPADERPDTVLATLARLRTSGGTQSG